jgi:GNAT superfamily N-acetyltransferase
MLRPAVLADIPRLLAIRDAAGADALSDPALIGETELTPLTAGGAVTVWQDGEQIVGFAATDGGALHLLVESTARGRGVGRFLLRSATTAIWLAGHRSATVSLPPNSDAERYYRADDWIAAGPSASGGIVLQKPL